MKTHKLLPLVLTLALALAGQVQAQPFQPKTDLKRVMVGNQAGLLKVLTPERKVAHTRGIDDRNLALMSESDREALLSPLGIGRAHYGKVATQLMKDFDTLPRKEAVAVLGALGSSQHLDPATRSEIEGFMVRTVQKSPDVYARRQAVLALAVLPEIQPATVEAVVSHYEKSTNLWETFPVQQFFEYHSPRIKLQEELVSLLPRLAKVPSLYTPMVLSYFD